MRCCAGAAARADHPDGAQLPGAASACSSWWTSSARPRARRPGRESRPRSSGFCVIVFALSGVNHIVRFTAREGVWREVPEHLQRPHPFRLHRGRHRPAVLVGLGHRCRRRLRRAGGDVDHRRASRCRTRSDRSSPGCSSSSSRRSRSATGSTRSGARGQIVEVNWCAVHSTPATVCNRAERRSCRVLVQEPQPRRRPGLLLHHHVDLLR